MATNPSCTRKEMDVTETFYRPGKAVARGGITMGRKAQYMRRPGHFPEIPAASAPSGSGLDEPTVGPHSDSDYRNVSV